MSMRSWAGRSAAVFGWGVVAVTTACWAGLTVAALAELATGVRTWREGVLVSAAAAGAAALAASAGSILARRVFGPGRHGGQATVAHWMERAAGPGVVLSLAMMAADSHPAAPVAVGVAVTAVAAALLADLALRGRSRPLGA